MRAHVNNLICVLRVPGIKSDATAQRSSWLLTTGRRLHSDAPSVAPAAVKAVPAAEARPPLADLIGRKHDYLRISLTERCNLRCKYCMPAEGVPLSPRGALLARAELARLARVFAALGVRKVRLTGGEPTIRSDLADIIQDLSQVAGIQAVGMTTNGLVLTRRLPALQRAGLTALNVSLDSLRADRYEAMARRPGLQRVLAGVDLALQLGYRPVKINTVLMKGFNDDEICDFVEYTRDREVEVRFIEFMPFSGNKWDDSKLVPHRAAVRALTQRYPDAMPCLPRPNDTARVWQVPGYAGSVGFISSMTNNFCSTCNRMRLTADGNLKVCLFGSAEVSLRDAVRAGATDGDIEALIRAALNNKKPQHAAPRPEPASPAATPRSRTPSSRSSRCTLASSKTTVASRPSTISTGPVTSLIESLSSTSAFLSSNASLKCTVASSKTTVASRLSTVSTGPVTPLFASLSSKNAFLSSNASSRLSRCTGASSKTTVTSRLATAHVGHLTPLSSTSALLSSNASSRLSSAAVSWKSTNALSLSTGSLIMPFLSLNPKVSAVRSYSTGVNDGDSAMTHLDGEGRARMVDVGEKAVTSRIAEAECSLRVGARLLRLLHDARLPKGDALTVAQIAGVMGAKRTSDLIPLCHPLPLDCVRVTIVLPKGECNDGGDIRVNCEVRVTSRTGAEMEALTGAAVAALALYDMCKSVDKHMKVMNLRVVRKCGGRSGDWPRRAPPEQALRAHDTSPIRPDETFAPTNFMHF